MGNKTEKLATALVGAAALAILIWAALHGSPKYDVMMSMSQMGCVRAFHEGKEIKCSEVPTEAKYGTIWVR